ncbi:MAG: class I SAM-dependent methyltransferase [Beijerinckiaceae bacterium]|nr:class I SAM-dependent methyltransferase [Beijerinckiaceae bacterium]
MQKTILIFPATTIEAQRFASLRRRAGWRVVGAASVPPDGARAVYDEWLSIPFVHDDGFAAALSEAIATFNVQAIYSSHEVVSEHLRRALPTLAPDVALETKQSHDGDLVLDRLLAEAYAAYVELVAHTDARLKISADIHRAVLGRAVEMRGESGLKKLSAIMAVMADCPKGDIIEIGTFAGRSAFVLGWSARRYGVGPTLCIDPWNTQDALQADTSSVLQDVTRSLDFEAVRQEFLANLVPIFFETLNYRQERADIVSGEYGPEYTVGPTEFGTTCFAGKVAFLHVDGNHDHAAATLDLAAWAPKVAHRGIVVVDDYEWSFGTGPKRAADELLQRGGEFETIGLVDGALFLRRVGDAR